MHLKHSLIVGSFLLSLVAAPTAGAYVKIYMPVRAYVPAADAESARPAGWPGWIGYRGAPATPTRKGDLVEYAPAGWSLYPPEIVRVGGSPLHPDWPGWIGRLQSE